ncbi:hypothetical protein KJ765_00520 [Candidatus Micrarchaeota archaeon]|nr:hypothetical protein [Candidatus Micrarchaeota archaeon]
MAFPLIGKRKENAEKPRSSLSRWRRTRVLATGNRIERMNGVEIVLSRQVIKHPEKVSCFSIHLTKPVVAIGSGIFHYYQVRKHLGHAKPAEYRHVIRGYVAKGKDWHIQISADTTALHASPLQVFRLLTGLHGFLQRIGKGNIEVHAFHPYVSPTQRFINFGRLPEAIGHFKRLSQGESS